MILTITVENTYSDGHESKRTETVDVAPFGDVDELWELLHEDTGDGHGTDADLGYCYEITIVDAPECPELVGEGNEWVGA